MGDIVITEQQIKKWQEERAELEEKILEFQNKLELISQRLGALFLFSESTEESRRFGIPTIVVKEPTATTTILNILDEAARPMSPKEIRGAALKTSFPREKWGKNFGYFYTALKRLVDSDRIHKDGDRYFLPLLAVEGTEID